MAETTKKKRASTKTIDRRLRAARLRDAKAREYVAEVGGEDRVVPTTRDVIGSLATVGLVIAKFEDQLALGHTVDLQELTRLIAEQRHLIRALREATGGQVVRRGTTFEGVRSEALASMVDPEQQRARMIRGLRRVHALELGRNPAAAWKWEVQIVELGGSLKPEDEREAQMLASVPESAAPDAYEPKLPAAQEAIHDPVVIDVAATASHQIDSPITPRKELSTQ